MLTIVIIVVIVVPPPRKRKYIRCKYMYDIYIYIYCLRDLEDAIHATFVSYRAEAATAHAPAEEEE